jgi:hypothetical protein
MADAEVVTELTIDASGTQEGASQYLQTMQEIEVVLQSLLNVMMGVQTQFKSVGDQMELVVPAGNGAKDAILGVTDALGGTQSSATASAASTGILGDSFSTLESAASAAAGTLGQVGSVLGLLVTGGLIAGAVAGIKAMSDAADAAGESANVLVTAASNLSLTTAQLQALEQAGKDVNVTTTATDEAIQHFAQQLDSVRQGTGALYTDLMRVNPALALQMQTTKSLPVELMLLAQAYSAAGIEADKLAKTALGTNSASALGKGVLGSLATSGMTALTVNDQAGLGPTSDEKEKWSELVDQIKTAKAEASDIFSSIFTTPFLEGELKTAQFMDDFAHAAKEFSLSGDLSKFIEFFSKEMPAMPELSNLFTGGVPIPTLTRDVGNDVFGPPPVSATATPEQPAPAIGGGFDLSGRIQSMMDWMSSNAFAGYGKSVDYVQSSGTGELDQFIQKIENVSVSADLKSLLATLSLQNWPLLDKLATLIGTGAGFFGHDVANNAGPGRMGGLSGFMIATSEAVLQEGFSAVVGAIQSLSAKGVSPAGEVPYDQSTSFAERFAFSGQAAASSGQATTFPAAPFQAAVPQNIPELGNPALTLNLGSPSLEMASAPSVSPTSASSNPLASSDMDAYLKEQTAQAKILAAAIDALNASESKIPQTAMAAFNSYRQWESALGGAATAAEQMELESRKLAAANPPLSADVIQRAQTYKDLQIQIASEQQMVTAAVGAYATVLTERRPQNENEPADVRATNSEQKTRELKDDRDKFRRAA